MSMSRRDFMKFFGVSVASLILARCQQPIFPAILPTATPTESLSARERLRQCWLGFNELAQKTIARQSQTKPDQTDPIGEKVMDQMIVEHRLALSDMVTAGDITVSVADLIQEAYAAAAYHVYGSNGPMVCYTLVASYDYSRVSAEALVQQAEILGQVAEESNIDPQTLAKAQTALEHDLAFYALDREDENTLENRLWEDYSNQGLPVPSFEELQLELTPDVKAAAQFIVDLLTK